MCGLAGIIGGEINREHLLHKMLLKQNHRGPDYKSIWSNSKLCLGHNRLSIIDLSSMANQPMVSLCGNFVIVFNGEIYNYLELRQTINDYKFISNSDTEVILALYIKFGKEMLSMINGMFSFVIYNGIENKIFGAGLDVFDTEPPDNDNPLLKNDKTFLSPHTAAFTEECMVRMGKETIQNIIDFFDKKLEKSKIVKL